MLENLFCYIFPMYEFLHSLDPKADSDRNHSISNSQPEADALELLLPFHFTKLMIAILMILQCQRSGLERERASIVLDRLLEIEILYREVVVSVFVRAAHGCIIRIAHGLAHGLFPGYIAIDRFYCAVDQHRRIVSLGGVKGWIAIVFPSEVSDELLVGVIRKVDDPMLCPWHVESKIGQARQ